MDELTSRSSGFTLVEVLIATTILAMVMTTGSLAYWVFLGQWRDGWYADKQIFEKYKYDLLLRNSIESLYDYYVTDRANEALGNYYSFFYGEKHSMEYVTLSSMFNAGSPAIAHLFVEGHKDNKQLVYEESSLDTAYIKYGDEIPKYTKRVILENGVISSDFSYFVVKKIIYIPGIEINEYVYGWSNTSNGKDKSQVPIKIQITLTTKEGTTTRTFTVKGNMLNKKERFLNE